MQRARLLNLMLADLYGSQSLLASGHLPPELIFAHPGFLRPCHRVRVPYDVYLHLYATHLARGPDGRWLVLADRAQTPFGGGYAVENRIVISRMLPNMFHDCRVQRLASFFISVRETLQGLAAHHRDNPRIVLLSPGPTSPTYFEDAYLARYLGYTLVEGGDLTVRDNRVFLKTLGGLIPTDVILRRVFDEECDPLELQASSRTGASGLLQAVRCGNVVVANAMGSGLLEAPALMAYLPGIARHLLGEELKLPSVETWWCGQRESLNYVVQHLDQLVVKPAFTWRHRAAILWRAFILGCGRCRDLISRIKASPRVHRPAMELQRSTAPGRSPPAARVPGMSRFTRFSGEQSKNTK